MDQDALFRIIPIYLVLFVGVYFLLIRPNKKRKAKEEKMRANLRIGDEITTIGGIVAKIVSIKEDADTVVIESSSDRSRMKIKRWAVATCDTVHDD